jgi:predicted amidohydrolase
VLAQDGAVEVYTKRRLGAFPSDANAGGPVPPAEASVFAPGDRDPLVHVGGVAAAIAVCADVGSAEHAARAAARGARAYLASMFVIPADLEQEEARLRDRAVRHGMTVVLANHGAPTGGLPSAGRSAIWSERGEVLARLPVSGTGLALASGRTIAPA